jgi:hypothetical protein
MGGAVFLYGGKISLTNCTLAGNAAVGGAGGAGNAPGGVGQGIGGAICGLASGITTSNCTIYNNIGDRGQIVTLWNGGVGRPAPVYLANTVVAGSPAPTGPDVVALALRGARPARIDGVGNFFGRPGRFPRKAVAGAGDPKLGPLGDNGGPTRTLAPMAGSPLIDAGRLRPRGGLASTDQRGLPRVVGRSVDIGSVEVS